MNKLLDLIKDFKMEAEKFKESSKISPIIDLLSQSKIICDQSLKIKRLTSEVFVSTYCDNIYDMIDSMFEKNKSLKRVSICIANVLGVPTALMENHKIEWSNFLIEHDQKLGSLEELIVEKDRELALLKTELEDLMLQAQSEPDKKAEKYTSKNVKSSKSSLEEPSEIILDLSSPILIHFLSRNLSSKTRFVQLQKFNHQASDAIINFLSKCLPKQLAELELNQYCKNAITIKPYINSFIKCAPIVTDSLCFYCFKMTTTQMSQLIVAANKGETVNFSKCLFSGDSFDFTAGREFKIHTLELNYAGGSNYNKWSAIGIDKFSALLEAISDSNLKFSIRRLNIGGYKIKEKLAIKMMKDMGLEDIKVVFS